MRLKLLGMTTTMTARTLTDPRIGTLLIAAGTSQAAGWSLTVALGGPYDSRIADAVGSLGWGVGWGLAAAALVLLSRSGIAGDRAGRRLPYVAVAGGLCYVLAETWWVANLLVAGRTAAELEETSAVLLLPAGAALGAIGMLLTGVAVLRARRWAGWHRWTPLLVGGYPFVGMFPVAALTGAPVTLSLIGWALTWLPLGIAARREARRIVTA